MAARELRNVRRGGSSPVRPISACSCLLVTMILSGLLGLPFAQSVFNSFLILSSLRCDSVVVSDDLNPSVSHPLFAFPALRVPISVPVPAMSACAASHFSSKALPTRLIWAVQVSLSRGPAPVSGRWWQAEVMLSFLLVLFLSGTSDYLLLAVFLFLFFSQVLWFVLITPLHTYSIVHPCKKLSCHLAIGLAIYWTSCN